MKSSYKADQYVKQRLPIALYNEIQLLAAEDERTFTAEVIILLREALDGRKASRLPKKLAHDPRED